MKPEWLGEDNRPIPFIGMILYRATPITSWYIIEKDNVDVLTARSLENTTRLPYTFYKYGVLDGLWWTIEITLPGEPGCPPIPEEYRHKWKDGDCYLYLADENWGRDTYHEEHKYKRFFQEKAIFVPQGMKTSYSKTSVDPYTIHKNYNTWTTIDNRLKDAYIRTQEALGFICIAEEAAQKVEDKAGLKEILYLKNSIDLTLTSIERFSKIHAFKIY